jgi:glutathione S-transferase
VDTLDGKPFLVEGDSPTLAGLAAYPQVVNLYVGGLDGFDGFLRHPELVQWLRRVSHFAESKQPLLPEKCKKRNLV